MIEKVVNVFKISGASKNATTKNVNLLADRFDVVCRIAAEEATLPDILFLRGAPRTTRLSLKDFSMRQ